MNIFIFVACKVGVDNLPYILRRVISGPNSAGQWLPVSTRRSTPWTADWIYATARL